MNSSGFEKDCPCGTGTVQCWDMLPEILPAWDRDCAVLGHALRDPAWDRDCTVLGHAMRDPACMGQGLHSVGTCYERSCLCGTGST